MKRIFFIILSFCALWSLPPKVLAQQTIKAVEYWTDTNFSEKTRLDLTPSTTYTWEDLIDMSALPGGLHTLNVRFQDEGGLWSIVHSTFFNKSAEAQQTIKAVEYWTDTNFNGRTRLDITPSTTYTWEDLIDMSALPDGLHTLNVRFQDGGLWTNVVSTFFNKSAETTAPIDGTNENRIDGYRIWFAAEPNFVDSFKVEAAQPEADVTEDIPLTYLPKGKYQIAYQFRDKRGIWSPVITDSIAKADDASFHFTADKREITEGDEVAFTPEFTIFIDSIMWSFGDGLTEVALNPVHQYNSVGEFDVTATVWHKGSKEGIDYVELKYITSIPTGIATPQVSTLRMYPVPMADKLTIDSPDMVMRSVRILTLDGVLMKEVKCGSTTHVVLSCGDFPQGCYLVTVETDRGTISRKIRKK